MEEKSPVKAVVVAGGWDCAPNKESAGAALVAVVVGCCWPKTGGFVSVVAAGLQAQNWHTSFIKSLQSPFSTTCEAIHREDSSSERRARVLKWHG